MRVPDEQFPPYLNTFMQFRMGWKSCYLGEVHITVGIPLCIEASATNKEGSSVRGIHVAIPQAPGLFLSGTFAKTADCRSFRRLLS